MHLSSSRPVQAFGALWQQVFCPLPTSHNDSFDTAPRHAFAFVSALLQAGKSAARRCATSPGFSALAIAVFALGIGANTTVFLLLDAVLFKPLPYSEPAKLVHITARQPSQTNLPGCLSYAHFKALRQTEQALTGIAAYASDDVTLTGRANPVRLEAARVSANFFSVLGVKPILGRAFTPADDTPSANPSVLIGAHLWRQRFASDPHIVGQQLILDSLPYTVIGILPNAFEFDLLGTRAELWASRPANISALTPQQVEAGACYLNAIGRLAPAVSLPRAQAALATRHQTFLRASPDADPKRALEVVPLAEKLTANSRPLLLLLAGTVFLFLLIACANIAGVSLARALDRRKEMAIRIALGATRRHVVVQLVAESLLLAFLGGLVGVALSLAARNLCAGLLSGIAPRLAQLTGFGWRVPAFSFALAALTGLLCGLAPALQFADSNLSGILRRSSRRSLGARRLLVIAQIAISVTLLVCAGLLAHGFVRLKNQPLGFNPNGVLSMSVALPQNRYTTPEQITNFFSQLLVRLRALPGVRSAALSSALPLNESRLAHVLAEGQLPLPASQRELAAVQSLSPAYLEVLRVPMLRGRFFTPSDTPAKLHVAVVNRAFARHFFPGQEPLGKRVWLGKMPVPWQIVGIVGDVKNVSLSSAAQPELDVPFAQLPAPRMNLLVLSDNTGAALADELQAAIAKQDRDQPATDVQTLEDLLIDARSQPRLLACVLSVFAALAFIIAAAGIYSVISYQAAQRKPEFAIRMALGATRCNLIGLVLSQAARFSGIGIVIGLLATLAITRAAASLLYGVHPFDPLSFLLAPALFFVVALLAALYPALRVTRLRPADVLRTE